MEYLPNYIIPTYFTNSIQDVHSFLGECLDKIEKIPGKNKLWNYKCILNIHWLDIFVNIFNESEIDISQLNENIIILECLEQKEIHFIDDNKYDKNRIYWSEKDK